MEADWVACTPWSPFRPPWWRWGRTQHLLDNGWRINRTIDDEWVVAARAVLRRRAVRHPRSAAIRHAHSVWSTDDQQKWELEALLLTSESFEKIASRMGTEPLIVEAYAKVFFAVRDAPKATDWIYHRVIGYSTWTGFTAALPAAAWRYAAYVAGVRFLDVMMAVTTGRPFPAGLFNAGGEGDGIAETCFRLRFRLWLLTESTEDTAAVARAIRLMRKLDALTPRSQAEVDHGLRMHEQFLLRLPRILRKAAAGAREEQQRRKSKTPAEAMTPKATTASNRPARSPSRGDRPRIDDSEQVSKSPPNPRRVAAGAANRAKRKGLTAEGRERLRRAALDHQPWQHASGPRTEAGKAKAAMNGRARQKGQYSVRALRAELAAINGVLRSLGAARSQAQGG